MRNISYENVLSNYSKPEYSGKLLVKVSVVRTPSQNHLSCDRSLYGCVVLWCYV